MTVTEDTYIHPRVLKRHYVEINDAKWEVSTIRTVEEPDHIGEAIAVLSNIMDGVDEKYETMIFKIIDDDGTRYTDVKEMRGIAATDFGHYRGNESQDIVKAHSQIVSLIADGKLKPVECKAHSDAISPHILKAMMKEEPEFNTQQFEQVKKMTTPDKDGRWE